MATDQSLLRDSDLARIEEARAGDPICLRLLENLHAARRVATERKELAEEWQRRRETLDAVWPNDPLSEKEVLGHVVLDPGLIDTLALTVDHFTVAENRVIWQVILTLRRDGIPVDLPHLLAAMRSADAWEAVGPAYALAEVMTHRGPAGRFDEYVRRLMDVHNRRLTVWASIEAIKSIAANVPTKEVVSYLIERLTALDV